MKISIETAGCERRPEHGSDHPHDHPHDRLPDSANPCTPDRTTDQAAAASWTLTGLLRTGGTAALVAALAQFLLVGVHVDNDLQRFALLLLQTGVFTGCAFVLQRVLQDTKSARLLLGVSLVSVVAGFAVLGAMLYATYPMGATAPMGNGGTPLQPARYAAPGLLAFTQWHGASAAQTLVAALVAALVLLPTARFGFAVLARASAGRLTMLTALASLALLIPLRDPAAMGLIAAAALLGVAWAQRGMLDRDPGLATPEGRFARAIPFLPVAVVIVRTCLLHQVHAGFALPIGLAVWLMIRSTLVSSSTASRFATLGYALGMVAIAASALALSIWSWPTVGNAGIALMTLLASSGTWELRRHVPATRAVRTLDGLVLLLTGLTLAFGTALEGVAGFSGLWPILATVPLIVYAFLTRRTVLTGSLAFLLGWQLLMVGEQLLALLDDHGWQSLIGIGLVAMVSAGWIERRRVSGGVSGGVTEGGAKAPPHRPDLPSDRPAA